MILKKKKSTNRNETGVHRPDFGGLFKLILKACAPFFREIVGIMSDFLDVSFKKYSSCLVNVYRQFKQNI